MAASTPKSINVDDLFRHIFLGGSAHTYLLLARATIGDNFPPQFRSRDGIQFLESLSKEQIDIISTHSVLLFIRENTVSLEDVRQLLENKQLLLFLAQLREARGISEASKRTLFDLLQAPTLTPGMVSKNDLQWVTEYLTYEQFSFLTTGIAHHELSTEHFYALEKRGQFAPSIQERLLHEVPIEPLIRWLATHPFATAEKWLQDPLPTQDGQKRRIDTLSENQKHTILRRFRRFESQLPQEQWMRLFGIDEKTAWDICRTEIAVPTPTVERLNSQIGETTDSRDPQSLFLLESEDGFPTSNEDLIALVTRLLMDAKENTLCGARNFLKWGTAPENTSVCCDQDSVPLTVRYGGETHQIYTGGLFSDALFPVPTFTLRRRLMDAFKTVKPEEFYEGQELSEKQLEVFFEVDRIAKHLAGWYAHRMEPLEEQPLGDADSEGSFTTGEAEPIPEEVKAPQPVPTTEPARQTTLEEHMRDRFEAFLHSEDWKTSTALHELVLALYRHITEDSQLSKLYDKQSRSNTATYCLLSLLWLCRQATIEQLSPLLQSVTISPRTKYLLQNLADASYEERYEDNAWLTREQFHQFTSSYAPHTLSPLTPNRNFPPSCFASLSSELKRLESTEFYALCERTLSIRSMEEDTVENYIAAFGRFLAEGKQLSEEARRLLISLVDHYMSFVSDSVQPLVSNRTYFYNVRGLGQFVERAEVPEFIESEGNFASAICHFYTPINTTRHEGNCCVESILTALNGKERYMGEDGDKNLGVDIRDFRAKSVEYARDHKAELSAEFGEAQVDEVLRLYATELQNETTGSVVFACTCQRYGRPILVYSRTSSVDQTSPMYTASSIFTTDEDAALNPYAVFQQPGVTTGAPIRLMYWQHAHYALLKDKHQ